MITTHFTAWLTTDASRLEGDNCDLTVLEDQAISYKTPVWEPRGEPLLYAVTNISATSDDEVTLAAKATNAALDLLHDNGWDIALEQVDGRWGLAKWEAVPTGYIVAVERDA